MFGTLRSMRRQAARWVGAGAAVLVLVLGSCGGDDSGDTAAGPTTAATATTPPAPVTVQAIDNSFRPDPLEVPVGTEVIFENRGRNDHNVLPKGDPAAAAWGVQKEQFAPGDVYSHVFDEPGTYAYYCSIHGTDAVGMVGTIIVAAP